MLIIPEDILIDLLILSPEEKLYVESAKAVLKKELNISSSKCSACFFDTNNMNCVFSIKDKFYCICEDLAGVTKYNFKIHKVL